MRLMKAKEILNWFGYAQGTASLSDIEELWEAWPEGYDCVYVTHDSALESAGLRAGNDYTVELAYKAIGCEVYEVTK